jgi:Rad3-related DNA helicase
MPNGIGEKYDIEIETMSKPGTEYTTAEYLAQELPKAPAIIIGDEVVVEGSDVSHENLEMVICTHLGLPKPKSPKKGIISRFLHI